MSENSKKRRSNQKNCLIGLYRYQNAIDELNFTLKLEELITKLKEDQWHDIAVMGDFNVKIQPEKTFIRPDLECENWLYRMFLDVCGVTLYSKQFTIITETKRNPDSGIPEKEKLKGYVQ